MFKGFQGFSFINSDLETIFNNGLNSNYNIKLALSDIQNLLVEYKNEIKNISSSMFKILLRKLLCIEYYIILHFFMFLEKIEHGEFNKKFPDVEATYSINVDIKIIRLLLKKIEYYLSWVNENEFLE